MEQYSKDPLHGITLERLLTTLVEQFGWEALAREVNINCFKSDPSIKSSLKFLRRTAWARKQVEELYIHSLECLEPQKDNRDEVNNPWGKWAK
ncbi:MAG: VF530 family protein [Enterobacteriaceae bacterium]|jgi:uncharacterized protein (DUF2132 family)|nr:VF530 family protein [Enterobacteriaceae bacterium]